jgi:hypothetical protein
VATLQGVTLATAQTNAFQNAFVAGLCAQIQVEMSSFQCSSIAISSISSSSESRRLLQATSSGSVKVEYIIYVPSAAEVTTLNQQSIAPTDLVKAVADAYTGDAEVDTLTAAVEWAAAIPPALWEENFPNGHEGGVVRTITGGPTGGESRSICTQVLFPAGYSASTREWLLTYGNQGKGNEHWLFNNDAGLQFGVWGGSQIQSGESNPTANWKVVCTTYDSDTSKYTLYHNGIEFGSETLTAKFNVGSPVLTIEAQREGRFSGTVERAAVWGTALSADDMVNVNAEWAAAL